MYPIRLKAVFAAAAFWALAVSTGATEAPSQSKSQATDAIQSVFAEYKGALLQGDGAKAADVVSARTIAFYDGVVRHALNTPRAELTKLDFIAKFMVLRIRHEFPKSQISQMTGRELLAIGVDKGWISKSSVANIERLVNVKVDASKASASMPMAPDIPAFHFLKESGQWKLDLVASFALATDAMKQEITKTGLSEEQFIIRALTALSSKPVNEAIFSPPL